MFRRKRRLNQEKTSKIEPPYKEPNTTIAYQGISDIDTELHASSSSDKSLKPCKSDESKTELKRNVKTSCETSSPVSITKASPKKTKNSSHVKATSLSGGKTESLKLPPFDIPEDGKGHTDCLEAEGLKNQQLRPKRRRNNIRAANQTNQISSAELKSNIHLIDDCRDSVVHYSVNRGRCKPLKEKTSPERLLCSPGRPLGSKIFTVFSRSLKTRKIDVGNEEGQDSSDHENSMEECSLKTPPSRAKESDMQQLSHAQPSPGSMVLVSGGQEDQRSKDCDTGRSPRQGDGLSTPEELDSEISQKTVAGSASSMLSSPSMLCSDPENVRHQPQGPSQNNSASLPSTSNDFVIKTEDQSEKETTDPPMEASVSQKNATGSPNKILVFNGMQWKKNAIYRIPVNGEYSTFFCDGKNLHPFEHIELRKKNTTQKIVISDKTCNSNVGEKLEAQKDLQACSPADDACSIVLNKNDVGHITVPQVQGPDLVTLNQDTHEKKQIPDNAGQTIHRTKPNSAPTKHIQEPAVQDHGPVVQNPENLTETHELSNQSPLITAQNPTLSEQALEITMQNSKNTDKDPKTTKQNADLSKQDPKLNPDTRGTRKKRSTLCNEKQVENRDFLAWSETEIAMESGEEEDDEQSSGEMYEEDESKEDSEDDEKDSEDEQKKVQAMKPTMACKGDKKGEPILTQVGRFIVHRCLFCEKFYTSISQHYQNVHQREHAVAEILSLPKRSYERRLSWRKLVNRGDCQHNFTVMEERKGVLIPKKRSSSEVSDIQVKHKYVPCEFCFRSILVTVTDKSLERHHKLCPARKRKELPGKSEKIKENINLDSSKQKLSLHTQNPENAVQNEELTEKYQDSTCQNNEIAEQNRDPSEHNDDCIEQTPENVGQNPERMKQNPDQGEGNVEHAKHIQENAGQISETVKQTLDPVVNNDKHTKQYLENFCPTTGTTEQNPDYANRNQGQSPYNGATRKSRRACSEKQVRNPDFLDWSDTELDWESNEEDLQTSDELYEETDDEEDSENEENIEDKQDGMKLESKSAKMCKGNEKGSILTQTDRYKLHKCLFCDKFYSKISRHYQNVHSKEPAVAEILSLPKCSEERRHYWNRLMNRGDYQHNHRVMKEGRGVLIPRKRSIKEGKRCRGDVKHKYAPCEFCLGSFVATESGMQNHRKSCPARKRVGQNGESRNKDNDKFRHLIVGKNKGFYDNIFSKMFNDCTKVAIGSDPLMLSYADKLYQSYGSKEHMHHFISNKLQELVRLLMILKQSSPTVDRLRTALSPDSWDKLLEAVRNMSGYEPEKRNYRDPLLPLKLGYSLCQCAKIMQAEAFVEKDEKNERNAREFLGLYAKEWEAKLSSAYETPEEDKNLAKTSYVQLADDAILLVNYLEDRAKRLAGLLEQNPQSEDYYSELAEVCLTQLMLFNGKRGGEVQAITMEEFLAGTSYSPEPSRRERQHFSKFEQHLCKNLMRMEFMNKLGCEIPILITEDILSNIDVMMDARKNQETALSDILFVRPRLDKPLRGKDCLWKFASRCYAKSPQMLVASKHRRHLANMVQILHVSEGSQDILCSFIDTNLNVHLYGKFCKMSTNSLVLARMAKLVHHVNTKLVSKDTVLEYPNVEINDQVELDDVEEDDDESDDSEEETVLVSRGKKSLDPATGGWIFHPPREKTIPNPICRKKADDPADESTSDSANGRKTPDSVIQMVPGSASGNSATGRKPPAEKACDRKGGKQDAAGTERKHITGPTRKAVLRSTSNGRTVTRKRANWSNRNRYRAFASRKLVTKFTGSDNIGTAGELSEKGDACVTGGRSQEENDISDHWGDIVPDENQIKVERNEVDENSNPTCLSPAKVTSVREGGDACSQGQLCAVFRDGTATFAIRDCYVRLVDCLRLGEEVSPSHGEPESERNEANVDIKQEVEEESTHGRESPRSMYPVSIEEFCSTSQVKVVTCKLCESPFCTQSMFEEHFLMEHVSDLSRRESVNSLRCTLCSMNVKSIQEIDRHLKRRHPEIKNYADGQSLPFKTDTVTTEICNMCDASFVFDEQLVQHLTSVHMEGQLQETEKLLFSCLVCNQNFESKEEAETHIKSCHKEFLPDQPSAQ